MTTPQERYDAAMLVFSRGDYPGAVAAFRALLEEDPGFFDARLALGMALFRSGDTAAAIAEGHRAEKMRPRDQMVHMNLSLFYVQQGNKGAAEHHGMQARIAAWNSKHPAGQTGPNDTAGLEQAAAKPAPVKLPGRFPDMPWKKKAAANPADSPTLPPISS